MSSLQFSLNPPLGFLHVNNPTKIILNSSVNPDSDTLYSTVLTHAAGKVYRYFLLINEMLY